MTPDEIMGMVREALEEGEGAVFLYRRQGQNLQCIAFGEGALLEEIMGELGDTRH